LKREPGHANLQLLQSVRLTFPEHPPSGLGLSADTTGHIAHIGCTRFCSVALFVTARQHGARDVDRLLLSAWRSPFRIWWQDIIRNHRYKL